MVHPQIATFARLADGGARPTRKIEGQTTLLSRTIHAIAYDEIHDEFSVPVPFPQAILTFRGGADGEEAPIRIIQGSRTQLKSPNRLAVDPVHNLLVVVPDPVSIRFKPSQVLIFDRTASGNAKPLRIIRGPKTQLTGAREVTVYPPRELFLVSITEKNGEGYDPNNFIGVWSTHDNGDVPPRWTIGGPNGILRQTRGNVLDPKNKTVIVADKFHNGILTFHIPEIF